jgi:hypothetical protein
MVMKQFCFLMGMLIMGSTLWAQVGVSIDGHGATNFTSVAPTIGLKINLKRIDIVGGLISGFIIQSVLIQIMKPIMQI